VADGGAALSYDDFMSLGGGGGTPAAGASPAPAPAAAPAPAGGMSFDDFMKAPGPSGAAVPHGKLSGPVANLGAGANDVITGMLGAPVDAATWLLNQGGPTSPGLGIEKPVGGSDWWKEKFGYVGANPDNVVAADGLDRVARGTGQGVANMVLPFGVAKAIPEAATAAPTVANGLVDALRAGSLTGNAAVGAVGGATGKLAAETVPDEWKPTADLVGNLVGGGLAAAAGTGARALASAGADAARGVAAPFTQAGRETLAGQRLRAESSDPAALVGKLDVENPELVPGSAPTTYQLTGDNGLGQLERAQAAKSPDAFLARRADQNAARVGAIDGMAPESASAAAPGEFFQRQLADLDSHNDALVDAARQRAAQSVDRLGGNLPRDQYGAAIRDELTDAKGQAKARESALWNAIDPEGKLAVDVSPVQQAASRIVSEIPRTALPPQGEEAAILQLAGSMQPVMPFSDLTALRGRLLQAIRDERFQGGETPALRRMTQLRSSIDDAISNAAAQKASADQSAVASGQMKPEDAFLAKVQAQTQQWTEARRAAGVQARGEAGIGAVGVGSTRPATLSAGLGSQGQARGRLGNGPRDQGVQGTEPLTANFDADAAARYRAAADATRERKQTFNVGPVDQALRGGPNGSLFNAADSQVTGKFFNSGSRAAEDVNAYLKAVGDRPRAVDLLKDYAASSLRTAAQRADGTLDPRKVESWLGRHADALRSFPELAEKFRTAAGAEQAVGEAMASRKAAHDAYLDTAAKHFIGTDPIIAVGRALGSANPSRDFAQLASMVGKDPDAKAGLQRAIVEYVRRNFLSNTEGGSTGVDLLKSDALQTFIKKNRGALGWVFSKEQLDGMEAVAADLKRANRSVAGTKLPGGSNTTQDTAAVGKYPGASSLMQKLVTNGGAAGLGASLGGYLAGPIGAGLGSAAGVALNMARAAGLSKVDELMTQAMLDPALARALVEKTAPGAKPMLGQQLVNRLRALAAVQAGTAGARLSDGNRTR